ncbi:MAG: oligosaccharide flippase family protein [Gammaproteobacteria bacterium]
MVNLSHVLRGTAISQLLALLSTPLLTRLYTPSEFGAYSVFVAAVSILGATSCFRYELAIPLEKKNKQANYLVGLCITFLIIYIFLLSLILLFCIDELASHGVDGVLIYMLPISVFSVGVLKIGSNILVRDHNFLWLGWIKVIQTSSTSIVQLLGNKYGALGLIIGFVLGQLSAIVLNFYKAKYSRSPTCTQHFSKYTFIVRKYKNFPLYSAPEVLLSTLSLNSVPLIILVIFGPVEAGLFALAQKVGATPISMLGNAISQVFLGDVKNKIDRGELSSFVYKYLGLMTALLFPSAALLIFSLPIIFEFIFGPNWARAGTLLQLVLPWMLLKLIASPLSIIFNALLQNHKGLIWQFLFVIFRVMAISIALAVDANINLFVNLFSIASSLAYVVLVLWICRVISCSVTRLLRDNIRYLLVSFIFSLIGMLMNELYVGGLLSTMGLSLLILSLMLLWTLTVLTCDWRKGGVTRDL